MMIPFNPADLIAIQPELVLLGATCAILLIDLFIKPSQRDITGWLSVAALALTSYLVWRGAPELSSGVTAFNGMFLHDGISVVLKQFILLTSGLSLFYARNYMRERSLLVGELYLLVLFATLGMMLLVSAGSLITVYLGLELLALSSYALVAMNRDSASSAEAAIKYFVLGALASGLLLYGMSMVYGATGTLEFSAIAQAIYNQSANQSVLMFGLVFLVAGICFKLGVVPFHMWVPDTYQGAPTAVTLLIATALCLWAIAQTKADAWAMLAGSALVGSLLFFLARRGRAAG